MILLSVIFAASGKSLVCPRFNTAHAGVPKGADLYTNSLAIGLSHGQP